ncbi:hypothetical protein RD792_013469 [Penstemon davidsonii]|uniref:phytol kinase n=1 Tax=Penstemon davidsonii TaxID=160366 RepID=A0ABR0CTM4_9LAMI|nr:hypothetical protein RD792_013469 [Penstemon davidsonii]
MAYSALISLGAQPPAAVTSSSTKFLRRHVATPSPTFRKYILISTPRKFRRPSATVFSDAVVQDAGATALVVSGAYALVSIFDNLTRRSIIEQDYFFWHPGQFSADVFILDSTSTGARYFASLVPSINCLRLVINGLSLASDEGLVKSVTREGKPEELLKGPLYYVLVLIFCAIVFWRESPVGMISLAMMCGGDGIADIMGRRFGSLKIPYNQQKSLAGSLSMFLFGFLVSVGMLYYYTVLGFIQLDWMWTIERVAFVSFVATFVESLPTTGSVDDNISVPLASMLTAILVFGY